MSTSTPSSAIQSSSSSALSMPVQRGITYKPSRMSQSLPLHSTGSSSTLSQMKARRRQSQDTEFAFYERIVGMGYSEEEESDDAADFSEPEGEATENHDENSSQLQDEDEDESLDMEMEMDSDEDGPSSVTPSGSETAASTPAAQPLPLPRKKSAKAKGKARAVSNNSNNRISAEEKARRRREERRTSLNARRPVIVLKKDSGWSFSQSALFPPYMRQNYNIYDPYSPNSSPRRASAPYGSGHGQYGEDYDSEAEDRAVQVDEIFVSQEESRAILPFAS